MRRYRVGLHLLVALAVCFGGLAGSRSSAVALGVAGRVLLAPMPAPRNGFVAGDDGDAPWGEAGLAVDASGRLVAIDPGAGFAVARVTLAGELDRTFGDQGVEDGQQGSDSDLRAAPAASMSLKANGSLLLAGASAAGVQMARAAVVRSTEASGRLPNLAGFTWTLDGRASNRGGSVRRMLANSTA